MNKYVMCLIQFFVLPAYSQDLFPEPIVKKSEHIIELIKNKDLDSLSELMPYPFSNGYLNIIENKAQFKLNYKPFFDSLSYVFRQNNIHANDTTLYFLGGQLYLLGLFTLCDEGIIKTVLISTHNIIKERTSWVRQDTINLHPSLRKFYSNQVKCSTDSFLVRVDMCEFGLRLCMWRKYRSPLKKPDVIAREIPNLRWQGSLGLFKWDFSDIMNTYSLYNKLTCGRNNGQELWLSIRKYGESEKNCLCK